MIVIAGGIGSGKSIVARILRLKGFGVFDCDYEARLIMERDHKVMDAIRNITGDVYSNEGKLDRPRLAQIIFKSPDARNMVNKVVHQAVLEKLRGWIRDDEERNLFVETAIASQSGIAALARRVWWITAPFECRLERIKLRDTRKKSEILKIMEAQAKEEEDIMNLKIPVDVVYNGPEADLLGRVDSLLNQTIETSN